MENMHIDLSDIPEVRGLRKVGKNPVYERMMREGFTVREYYTPDDIRAMKKGQTLARGINLLELDKDEQAAMDEYNNRLLAL
jgi:hypothetical protein